MTKEEEEEKKKLLTNEIESWSKFEYALREEEDRILFKKMLNECQKEKEYSKHPTQKANTTLLLNHCLLL